MRGCFKEVGVGIRQDLADTYKNYIAVSVSWGSFQRGVRAALKGLGVDMKQEFSRCA